MGLPAGDWAFVRLRGDSGVILLMWDRRLVEKIEDCMGEFLFLFTLVIKLTIDSQDFPLHITMMHNLYHCVMVTCAQVIAPGSTIFSSWNND
jgi:hypothetical protein